MMHEERKKIIRYALDFDIESINTYAGYKGDLIVKIMTKHKEALLPIRKFALDLGIKEVVVKQNPDLVQYELYCITSDDDVYVLKTKDLMEEVHAKHPAKDVWEEGQFH